MNVTVVDKIRRTEVLAPHQVDALVVAQVIIVQGKPELPVLATAVVDSPERRQRNLISVLYDQDLKTWRLSCEPLAPASEAAFEDGDMVELLVKFEQATGATLPPISVIDVGVGIYATKGSRPARNPWLIEDGGEYEFRVRGRSQRFVAACQNGKIALALDTPRGPAEFFDPIAAFDAATWASLTRL